LKLTKTNNNEIKGRACIAQIPPGTPSVARPNCNHAHIVRHEQTRAYQQTYTSLPSHLVFGTCDSCHSTLTLGYVVCGIFGYVEVPNNRRG